jgi:hypothetical protein
MGRVGRKGKQGSLGCVLPPEGDSMVELIAKRCGQWVYVYNGLDACPLRCFLYWEWLKLFDIPIKEGTKKKVNVEEVEYL